jgi:hypothetical protein
VTICLSIARRSKVPCRTWPAVWLAFCVLLQSTVLVQHALAMATSVEICSTDGPKRVDADGKPISDAVGHDNGCGYCGVSLAAPPVPASISEPMPVRSSLPAFITIGKLHAQWLAPLSRGPPGSRRA